MSLHPKVKEYIKSLPTPSPDNVPTIQDSRHAFESTIVPLSKRPAIHSVEDRLIPTSYCDIPIRIYTPRKESPFGLLVFFHGGSFIMGNLETHDVDCRHIANESGYKVIAVDYRLAPEHPFPAALNDCYAVTKWVAEHAGELEGSSTKLAVSGSSAGGNLAASVALMARDRKEITISKQVLIYPTTNVDLSDDSYPSRREYGKGYGLSLGGPNYYLNEQSNAYHPYASPIKAESFKNLPSALVITAGYDPLRDEGEQYLVKLLEQGIHVEAKRFQGTIHGFMSFLRELDDYKEALGLISSFLRK